MASPTNGGASARDRDRDAAPGKRDMTAVHTDTQATWVAVKLMCTRKFGTLRAAFHHFNKNARKGDKTLDEEEFKSGILQMGVTGDVAADIWRGLDVDRSGDITIEEFFSCLRATCSDGAAQTTVTGSAGDPLYLVCYDRPGVQAAVRALALREQTARAALRHEGTAAATLLAARATAHHQATVRVRAARWGFLTATQAAARARVGALEEEERAGLLAATAVAARGVWLRCEAARAEEEVRDLEAELAALREAARGPGAAVAAAGGGGGGGGRRATSCSPRASPPVAPSLPLAHTVTPLR